MLHNGRCHSWRDTRSPRNTYFLASAVTCSLAQRRWTCLPVSLLIALHEGLLVSQCRPTTPAAGLPHAPAMAPGSDYRLTRHDCGECSICVYSRNLEAQDEDDVDPNLFDTGYTLAASTGLAKVSNDMRTRTMRATPAMQSAVCMRIPEGSPPPRSQGSLCARRHVTLAHDPALVARCSPDAGAPEWPLHAGRHGSAIPQSNQRLRIRLTCCVLSPAGLGRHVAPAPHVAVRHRRADAGPACARARLWHRSRRLVCRETGLPRAAH